MASNCNLLIARQQNDVALEPADCAKFQNGYFARMKTLNAPGWVALWTGGTLLAWLLYTAVFFVTTPIAFGYAALDAAANVAPLAMLAAALHTVIGRWVMPRSVGVQTLQHAGLAIAFSVTWYALTIVLMSFVHGLLDAEWTIYPFSGLAFTWQSFQGLILYGLIAAICYAIRGGRVAAPITIVQSPALTRYLVRDDEGLRPIDVEEIVSITGAQDYAEVATANGRHLVRMSLGEFEKRLDGARFLRIHRSAIINFNQLVRTEPAGGGRMLAHMTTGDVVATSRSGAQLLRSLAV